MNTATQMIKAKGYNLTQFLKVVGFSLSSYRRYEKEDSDYHNMLYRIIDELEVKNR